ncbi:MAG TPA: 6-carboxytetrahydropterin synthase [Gemmatimonadaceae bacterium]|nr:6-carboxytetrahydropterin synthase [Gemmatimonadaceae bacterium]
MPAFLTRRVSFAAAHRYRRPDWSEERNTEVFGRCARERYHGHSYTCEVTVTGAIDPETGMVANLGVLDPVLAAEVHDRFDHANINLDIPEFGEGKLIPTGEELARFIFDRVQARLGSAIRVVEVTVAEDATLSATWRGE